MLFQWCCYEFFLYPCIWECETIIITTMLLQHRLYVHSLLFLYTCSIHILFCTTPLVVELIWWRKTTVFSRVSAPRLFALNYKRQGRLFENKVFMSLGTYMYPSDVFRIFRESTARADCRGAMFYTYRTYAPLVSFPDPPGKMGDGGLGTRLHHLYVYIGAIIDSTLLSMVQ